MSKIHEIAAMAGVSVRTAARILAGGSPHSKDRETILKCAQALGYVRNQQAANLRTGRSRLIGVIVPYIENPFYTAFLQEMHDSLLAKNYQGLTACSFGNANSMLNAIRLFETYNIDGLVLDISEGQMTPAIMQKLKDFQARSRPVIITGGQSHDLLHDHLYLDNQRAIRKVVEFLAQKGHKKFGFLGGLAKNLNIINRLEGFKRALRDANLALVPEWISMGSPALSNVHERARAMLRGPSIPTAIVCTSDVIAMVASKVAIQLGLPVPGKLAVTGFDDIELAAFLNPSLTTLRQPMKSMALDIVEMMLSRLEDPGAPIRERICEADLIVRDSA